MARARLSTASLGRPGARGFAYLWVLLMIAATGAGATVAVQMWTTLVQREREAELLFAGDQYARAIGSYIAADPSRALPRRLEDLLRDARTPTVRRHLRRLYRDPMTGSAEWGLITSGGGIAGVYSRSEARPFKRAGFKERHAHFATAGRYSEWKFIGVTAAGTTAETGAPTAAPAAVASPGVAPAASPVTLLPVTPPAPSPTSPARPTVAVKPPTATVRTVVERQCRLIARSDAGTCAAMRSARGDAVASRCEQSAADRAAACVEANAFQGAMPPLATE